MGSQSHAVCLRFGSSGAHDVRIIGVEAPFPVRPFRQSSIMRRL
jgi:hypothetical protein